MFAVIKFFFLKSITLFAKQFRKFAIQLNMVNCMASVSVSDLHLI